MRDTLGRTPLTVAEMAEVDVRNELTVVIGTAQIMIYRVEQHGTGLSPNDAASLAQIVRAAWSIERILAGNARASVTLDLPTRPGTQK